MKLIMKMKQYGAIDFLRWLPSAIYRRIFDRLYKRAVARFNQMPIDNNLIVLESEGDLSDNAFALYDYMRANKYLEQYHVVWAVDDLKSAEMRRAAEVDLWPNTTFISKQSYEMDSRTINRGKAQALATCRWYLFDHNNLMAGLSKRSEQTVVYLSHGWGYKAPKGGGLSSDYSQMWDFMTVTGPLAANGMSAYWGYSLDKTVITGYPRLDYLFHKDEQVYEKINNLFNFTLFRKVIFWMPTFRQSSNQVLSENYISNETGLPLFSTYSDLIDFDKFLSGEDILVVLKIHHLQAELPIFSKKFTNILITKDQELYDMGIQLYQMIKYSDALITDYSSIAIDYLIMDRPLIYILDDYEQYNESRGLFPKNAVDYMPGYHVYDATGLKKAISEIADNIDIYKPVRSRVVDEYHTFRDGFSAKRVLNAVGII